MEHAREFYIDGKWVTPLTTRHARRDQPGHRGSRSSRSPWAAPTTSTPRSRRPRRRSRPSRLTTREERLALFDRIIEVYTARMRRARPTSSARRWARRCGSRSAAQAAAGLGHFITARARARRLRVREARWATTLVVREPIGVVRPDHAVELAAQPDRLQGRAGARRRLHDGAEAVRGRAAQRHHLRRDPRRGRRARRACSTSSTATASTSVRRCRPTPTST